MKTMKIGAALAAVVALTLTSCESKEKLAKDIEGTWGTNTRTLVTNTDALRTSAVDMIQFDMPEGVANPISGPFMMSSMVEVTMMAPPSDMIVQPYTVSVSGIASIAGDWTAIDHDEVMVNLNPSTFNVSIDPMDVVMEDNILSGENKSFVDSIKPALAETVKTQISSYMLQHFMDVKKIDDIHIKNDNKMKCEINDVDMYFTRQ